MAQIFKLNLIHEPIRRYLGKEKGQAPLHTKVLTAQDFNDSAHWPQTSVFSREKARVLFNWIQGQQNLLLKETNGLFQIPFLQEAIPSTRLIYLNRHLGGVLASHMRITNVIKKWHYAERINSVRGQVPPKYQEIYNRADKQRIANNPDFAILLAHLAVQTIEGQKRIKTVVDYESLTNGSVLMIMRSILGNIGHAPETSVEEKTNGCYLLHGTQNAPNPYGWLRCFSSDDYKAIQDILGPHSNMFFPLPTVTDNNYTTVPVGVVARDVNSYQPPTIAVPELTHLRILYDKTTPTLSNRLITIGEYVDFLNLFLKAGIDDVCLRLGVQDSYHTIKKENGRFVAKHPTLPITFLSPLAALAYCRHKGGKLPQASTYDQLWSVISGLHQTSKELVNYDEQIGFPTSPGNYPSLNGFYDLFGNVREFCQNDLRFLAVGGSYKDMECDLNLMNRHEIPFIGGDADIGFRIQESATKKDLDIIRLVKEARVPTDILRELL